MNSQEPLKEYPMDEKENIFLVKQVEAITRATYLMVLKEPTKKYSIKDVVEALAKAEKQARFLCGFVLLNQNVEYVELLEKYMVKEQYLILEDNEYVSLTEKGKIKSNISLPENIEFFL